MLFKPILGTDLSGKVGGVVASHNKGGAYFRAAVIPTNPNSPQQQAVRNAVSLLSGMWNDALTVAQRNAWDVYAANVTITNRIGEQINISGLAHYVRSNVSRLQFGHARVDDGPSVFNLGSHQAPSLTNASAGAQTVDLNFTVSPLTDPWANEVGGFLLLFLSRPQNQSINFFRGPYRATGSVTGDPIPPVSPSTFAVPFAIAAGQTLFGRAVSTLADGRYSTSSFMQLVTVA